MATEAAECGEEDVVSERDPFLEALKDLLRERSLTLSEAVRMYRDEKHCSLLDVKRLGVLAELERVAAP